MSIAAIALMAPYTAERLAGRDLRPARRDSDWRGETCAARLAGRDLRGAIGGERPARRDWRGDTVGLRGATDG